MDGQLIEMMNLQMIPLVRLIDDLLDIPRIGSGKIGLRKERFDLSRVFARIMETSRPLIDMNYYHLDLLLPPVPIPLEADPFRLAQVHEPPQQCHEVPHAGWKHQVADLTAR